MTRVYQLLQKHKFQTEGDGSEGGEGNGSDGNEGGNGGNGNGGNQNDKPSDKEAELLKEVMKRKGNEQSLKTEVGTLKEQLKQFEGIDVAQVRALLQEKTERERIELEKRGEFDRVKQQMVDQHQAELGNVRTTLEQQVTGLSGELNKAQAAITELTIGRSFGDSTFVRDTLTLTPAKARVVYGSHFELQDGKIVAFDKPAGAADRTVLVDASGAALPFDQAIEKIVKADPDYEHLLRSKVRQGAGSKSDNEGRQTTKVGAGRDRISAAITGGALKLPA